MRFMRVVTCPEIGGAANRGKPAPTEDCGQNVGVGLPAMAISTALHLYLTHIKAPCTKHA
ncbi:hypothetical protein GCM10009091_26040 [Pseudomonas brenneri]|nr:hypothetical protein GCM10009091_26040 [Pseudomonas brenneri]